MEINKDIYLEESCLSLPVQDVIHFFKFHKFSRVKIKLLGAGRSMYPFLYNVNFIEIDCTPFNRLKKGDIVMVYDKKNKLFCHRIVRLGVIDNNHVIFIKGDAQLNIQGPFNRDNYLGKVVAVESKNKFFPAFIGLNRFIGIITSKLYILYMSISNLLLVKDKIIIF